MRQTFVLAISWMLPFGGCHRIPNGSSIDRSAAQRLSDSFMTDLVANRVDLAIGKMEPEFQALGRTQADAMVSRLFNYCGRPLESDLRHDEVGTYLYADARRKPM